jgi:predicted DNA-binding ribbon-helix-helix protein
MKRHPHRGIILHGRPTSLRLEREFWQFLREIAFESRVTVTELIEVIARWKGVRVTLASAIRIFVASTITMQRPERA